MEDVAHSLYCFSRLAVSAALRSWLKYSLLLVIASSNLILIFRYFFLVRAMLVELWAVCWFARKVMVTQNGGATIDRDVLE